MTFPQKKSHLYTGQILIETHLCAMLVSASEVIVASDPTMPLAAASSSEGQKFYSLPRPNQAKLGTQRSRTPSPFRSMIKGLVKGKIEFYSVV